MVNKPKPGRRKRRVALAAQLVTGDDDDIIAWLEGIDGNKSAAIKTVVRRGLGLSPKTTDEVTYEDLEELKQQLDQWAETFSKSMQTEVVRLISEFAGNGQVVLPADRLNTDGSSIDDQRKQKRDKRIKSAKW